MASSFEPSFYFQTISELSQLLRARKVSARELARAFGERLEQIGPTLNALALALTKPAEKSAKAVDADLKIERYRSLVQGIPYGVKDLLSVAKFPTTWGAKPYADQVFDYDATVVTKLNATGAVLIGKLAMIELAGGGGYNTAAASLTGPCMNPWDKTRWAGGSSSGSAAAVAAGLVTFAIGSETSGSILTPAAFCGVTALRPTYGLVSRYGAMPLSWTMDKLGPLCRSAEDCGLVLHEIGGGDSKDSGSAGKSFYYAPQYARPFVDLKLGYAPADFEHWAAEPARPVFVQALALLHDCGLTIQPAKLPDFPHGPMTQMIYNTEGASVFEELIASGKVDQLADPTQVAGLRAALEIPAKDYLRAMRVRTLVKASFRDLFSELDVLVAPCRYDVAPKLAEFGNRAAKQPSQPAPAVDPGFRAMIPAGNLAGLPALCLPCGFVNGLPIALQLMGPAWSENTLLAIGCAFQQRTDFHKQHPAVGLVS